MFYLQNKKAARRRSLLLAYRSPDDIQTLQTARLNLGNFLRIKKRTSVIQKSVSVLQIIIQQQ